MGIIAFLVNMVLFSYLAFWLPYVLVRRAFEQSQRLHHACVF
jgi:hypothetical protein